MVDDERMDAAQGSIESRAHYGLDRYGGFRGYPVAEIGARYRPS